MSNPYVFYVNGMTCSSCYNSIASNLKEAYATNFILCSTDVTTADPKKTSVELKNDPREHRVLWEEIAQKIRDLGFSCEAYAYQPNDHQVNPDPKQTTTNPSKQQPSTFDLRQDKQNAHWSLGAFGCTAGIALLIVSLVMGGLPLIAMIPIACISIILTVILGAESYYEAATKLFKSGTLTMDTLFSISTIAVITVSIAAFFVPWLPMMFEVGLLIYGFRHIGIAIEETIKEKTGSVKFQDRAPKFVQKATNQGTTATELQHINPDDCLIIAAGEVIPLDGVCMNASTIYTTIKNGDPIPQNFKPGDEVIAGMKVQTDACALKIRVLRAARDSHLAITDAAIEQSIREKAPLEIKTNQLLTYFIPAVITLAVISGIVIGLFFPPALAIQCALSVLVSACPCTLGLIIPLAVKTGMHKAAEHGVKFKNAKILQQAEQIDTVVFDLNGTLTAGVPVLKNYTLLNNAGISERELLDLACSLEKKSTHPIGKAVYAFTKRNQQQAYDIIFEKSPQHSGAVGLINGAEYAIGNATLMHEKGVSMTAIEKMPDLSAGDSVVFIARKNVLLGYFIMTDPLRKDALRTVSYLLAAGKDIHLCTGADEATATRYAKALGITKVHANCLATSKTQQDKSKPAYIQALKEKGHKVAMVGDAANDVHAIAASDFGIAIVSQDSDALAQQQAGAVIFSGTLLPIVSAFTISEQTVSNIKQNLSMSLCYNLSAILVMGGLLLAIGFILNPAVGVALMAIQASLILLNVYRFKLQPLAHLDESTATATLDAIPLSQHKIIQNLPQKEVAPKDQHQSTPPSNNPQTSATTSFWSAPTTSNLQSNHSTKSAHEKAACCSPSS
ncbi:MAG: heavy metal translocating P-type ATPase [Legionellales bacterium]